MLFKVQVISKETIKPSSPTPDHLRAFKLSLLDQYMVPHYIPLILFYSASHDHQHQKLKESLSMILTRFYPLAGRMNIDDNQMIDCNDEGINLFEARVSCKLSQALVRPIDEKGVMELVPKDDFYTFSGPKFLVSIQVNTFDCGGIALSVCMSHKVADVFSLSLFLNAWASLSRGEDETRLRLNFAIASLCPPKHHLPFSLNEIINQASTASNNKAAIVTKRFVFDASNIEALKAKIHSSTSSELPLPTRVEAVCALLWRCFINVARQQRKTNNKSLNTLGMFLPVNMRRRMVPPESNLFGNFSNGTLAETTSTIDVEQLHNLASPLREAIKTIDNEYVRKLIQADADADADGDGVSRYYDSLKELHEREAKGEIKKWGISSWCNFGIYQIDFGFGKPIWTTFVNAFGVADGGFLMDTKCGTRIEACVFFEDEEDAAIFERDPYLIAFTTSVAQRRSYL